MQCINIYYLEKKSFVDMYLRGKPFYVLNFDLCYCASNVNFVNVEIFHYFDGRMHGLTQYLCLY